MQKRADSAPHIGSELELRSLASSAPGPPVGTSEGSARCSW